MKKAVVFLMVAAILLLYPLNNFLLTKEEYLPEEMSTSDGISYIENLASFDVQQAEKSVQLAEEIRNYVPETNAQRVKKILSDLKKGKTTYRKVLKKVYIAGDSLMKGLESYDILNKKRLITQISASLYHLEENIEKIVEINPPTLLIHYGVNMIDTEKAYLENYISMYTRLIKKLKKELPDTRIIISSLFPVDREIATAKRFGKINAYNKRLKKMCKELGVDYLNNTPLFDNKKVTDCYGSDGIHLSKKFYEKYWLRHVIKEMEIV